MENVVLIDGLGLLFDHFQLLQVLLLHVLQAAQHGCQSVCKELLDLDLHVVSEVLEADGHLVLRGSAQRGQLLHVSFRAVLAHVPKGLWHGFTRPVGQRHGKAGEVRRQVAVPLQPFVDVLRGQIAIVLVKLVPNQDGALVRGIHLLCFSQRGKACCIASLFDAEHDVVLVIHELENHGVDLLSQGCHGIILGIGPEPRQVNQAQVRAVLAFHLNPDGHLADILPTCLVGIAHYLHHLLHGV
mmetsp:Transcript_79860/g.191741  ORF Transcript_79860/g.191741 Transcript_79860/m.191741 type:complete len:242 (-) Transcript_79860:332-1057(-)